MVLTNGHCIDLGSKGSVDVRFPAYGEIFYDAETFLYRTATLITSDDGNKRSKFEVEKLLYGTTTRTDIGLYLLRETYADIEEETGIKPFIVAKNPKLEPATPIALPTSYWKDVQHCKIEATVPTLKEGDWIMGPSLRLSMECSLEHGASGSPLILDGTNIVVGVINTVYFGNDEACSFDNPCEVDEAGAVTVRNKKQPYGQLVHEIYSCLNKKNEFDLHAAGCRLPAPLLFKDP